MFLIVLACGTGCSRQPSGDEYLPATLGDLRLSKILDQKQSTQLINRMHRKDLGVSENLVAYYGGPGSNNTLFVSIYPDPEAARAGLMEMAMKISRGTSVFSPLVHHDMGGPTFFETIGMGMKHLFFRVENRLIWWQVEPDKAEATIKDLLSFYTSTAEPGDG